MSDYIANSKIGGWMEPAHPMVVKLHDDLIAIYGLIRERCQQQIDAAFDRVSRQVGFVLTTTLPVVFEFGEEGKFLDFKMGAEHLQGTLFERELRTALKPFVEDSNSLSQVAAGTYRLQMIWYEALKLKLRTDWVEPAHFRVRALPPRISRAGIEAIERDIPEPAHWFDPGAVIALEEVVVIAAIDEVYPELRLVERVGNSRALASLSSIPEPPLDPRVSPVRRFGSSLASLSPQPEPPDMAILGELAALLRRYGY